ncbi:MAG: DMT family transporter [Actinobacteria bacterium]|nr:MAG: DMT family transporter [Actinomycetota bacterium]
MSLYAALPVRRPTADLMLLATVSLWALNFTVSKYILDHGFQPLAYSAVRYACAALIFAGITLAWEGSLRVGRGDLPFMGVSTGVLFANQLAFVYALRFTTASTVALVFGTLPIFTALIARGSGVERHSLRFWLAACLSFAGVALVAVGSGGNLSADLKGDGLALLGVATWAAYSVAIGPLMRRYSPYRLSAVFLLAVTMALLAAGSGQLARQNFELGGLVWLGFAFAVLGPLVTTNLLWFTAIDRVGPSRASLFANLQPFLAAIVALTVLHEQITMVQVAGGLAIAGGIVLASRERTAPQPPAE